MSDTPKSGSRFPVFSKKYPGLWKPIAITGAGGAALTMWLDEILMFSQEILGLILLPLMAGLIYLLDILMFKDHQIK